MSLRKFTDGNSLTLPPRRMFKRMRHNPVLGNDAPEGRVVAISEFSFINCGPLIE